MGHSRWNFIDSPTRNRLDILDVNYYKSLVSKLLKVGAELEFNLPEMNNICKKENISCGCVNLLEKSCWTFCLNSAQCNKKYPADKKIEICEIRKTDCKVTSCETCLNFTYHCTNISCSHFISSCLECPTPDLGCSKCLFLYDTKKDPDNIRTMFGNVLSPNHSYGIINKSGVHSIKKDGSLLGKKGAEIITIGRRVDFWEFYKMFKNIIDVAVSNGAYVNERCSIHMHLLTSYYDNLHIENLDENGEDVNITKAINELERALPEIVLANFHQLVRKYQNAITWMAMGLNDKNHMTRWEKFRVSILDISPICKHMGDVISMVRKNSNDSKYGFVDYRFCTFDSQNNLKRFHVEFRALDALLSPSALAAFACLYYAMAIKAIEISRFGLLEMPTGWLTKAKEMKASILNGTGGWDNDRFSNTTTLKNYENMFKEEAIDLVQQLKHILLQIGPAYDVLEKIAKQPLAYNLCQGQTWEQIEEYLLPEQEKKESDLIRFVDEVIELRLLRGCDNSNTWVKETTTLLLKENIVKDVPAENIEEEILSLIDNKCKNGDAIWSTTMGTIVSI